jgi:hypothetical protein
LKCALRACSARCARSNGSSTLSGSTWCSNFDMRASRAGAVRAGRSVVLAHDVYAAIWALSVRSFGVLPFMLVQVTSLVFRRGGRCRFRRIRLSRALRVLSQLFYGVLLALSELYCYLCRNCWSPACDLLNSRACRCICKAEKAQDWHLAKVRVAGSNPVVRSEEVLGNRVAGTWSTKKKWKTCSPRALCGS